MVGGTGLLGSEAAHELIARGHEAATLALPPLPEGEYYHFQLLGMEVVEEDGTYLGLLSDFVESGSNDVYKIDCGNGDYLLLPALKQVMTEVDVAKKKMIVRLLPGLKEACMYHES